MDYRCVAASAAGFVQQLAVCYIGRGYHFYVQGTIPERKEPERIDQRIIERYGLGISKWTRARQRKLGRAAVQYLRFDRFFVLVATHGAHEFFTAERTVIRDFRRTPLRFAGYSISCRPDRSGTKLHPSVRIAPERMRELKEEFSRMAVHRSADELERAFQLLPFEPYAPVRDQMRILLRRVNRHRKAAGLELVPREAVRQRRKPLRPFAESCEESGELIENFPVGKAELETTSEIETTVVKECP